MEVTHPHPILNEIVQTADALLRRTPLFGRFCERIGVVKSGDGHALRIDFHGPGDFEFNAEMRLPHEHVWADVPRSGMIEQLLREAEESFVQLYDQHLAKKLQLADSLPPVKGPFEPVEEVEAGTPLANAKLIRDFTYSELIGQGLTEALDYVKASKPPRVIWEMPKEPTGVPPEADPEADELF